MASPDDKVSEQIYAGSLSILAVLIAVVGLVAAAHEKVSTIPYLSWKFQLLQWFMAALSGVAGLVAYLSLAKMRGATSPMWIIVSLSRVLIAGTVAATLGFVIVS
jgi:hypothetical protein